MDINKLNITELKALAFDSIVKIEQLKNDVQIIQGLIEQKIKEGGVEIIEESVKKETETI